jgi:hypothetical protein
LFGSREVRPMHNFDGPAKLAPGERHCALRLTRVWVVQQVGWWARWLGPASPSHVPSTCVL